MSIDCKATVILGEFSRGGKTRGNIKALDHDMGGKSKYTPFGIVDEDSGQLYIVFGNSYKTSDFIVDNIRSYWNSLDSTERESITHLQFKVDNGPESSGVRTQFLNRIVDLSEEIGVSIQLLYYPPYHSKYNPIERCWGILECHWNGTLLIDAFTMIELAKTMTWKGISPIVSMNTREYEKGISLTKDEMKAIEEKLVRNPDLPKWDILVQVA